MAEGSLPSKISNVEYDSQNDISIPDATAKIKLADIKYDANGGSGSMTETHAFKYTASSKTYGSDVQLVKNRISAPNIGSVTFDPNGGTGGGNASVYAYFNGWSAKKSGGTVFREEIGHPKMIWKDMDEFVTTGDTERYAQELRTKISQKYTVGEWTYAQMCAALFYVNETGTRYSLESGIEEAKKIANTPDDLVKLLYLDRYRLSDPHELYDLCNFI